jgi:dTDP-4-amino-4,6-dideoxygalactose transaminase
MKIIEKREAEFREYFHTKHVFFVSSGKAALLLILLALKSFRDRKNVVIPAYTCYSVPSAVVMAGLTVVPCDIRPDTLDFDREKLDALLNGDTLCVVPTHLFGIPSEVDALRDVCQRRGIHIVEDAAQAMGVGRERKTAGTMGDVSFFSLGRGKHVTCGSGGIVVTGSDEIAGAVQKVYENLKGEPVAETVATILSVFLTIVFLHPGLYWLPHGLPALKLGETKFYRDFPVHRLGRFKAGLLHRWRELLAGHNRSRSAAGEFYRKELNLENTLPVYSGSVPYLRFPVYVEDGLFRSAAYEEYRFSGVTRMYPDSVNNIEEIRGEFYGGEYRNSEKIAKTLVTLPTHPLLRDRDMKNICRIVKRITKPVEG